jgi:hypothetical protein
MTSTLLQPALSPEVCRMLNTCLAPGLYWFGDDASADALAAAWSALSEVSYTLQDMVREESLRGDDMSALRTLLCLELSGPRFPVRCFWVIDQGTPIPPAAANVFLDCCVAVSLQGKFTVTVEHERETVFHKVHTAGEMVKLPRRPVRVQNNNSEARAGGKLLLLFYPRLQSTLPYRAAAASRSDWFPVRSPLLLDPAFPRRVFVAVVLRTERQDALAQLGNR